MWSGLGSGPRRWIPRKATGFATGFATGIRTFTSTITSTITGSMSTTTGSMSMSTITGSLSTTTKSVRAATRAPSMLHHVARKSFHASTNAPLPMKVGSSIPGLDIYKDKDPPVALDRSEYPEWVDKLVQPLPGIAQLRKMDVQDADDKDKRRFLKLTRKLHIKQKNKEQ